MQLAHAQATMQLASCSRHQAAGVSARPAAWSSRLPPQRIVPRQHPADAPVIRDMRAQAVVATKEKWWQQTTPNMREIEGGVQELVDALSDAGDALVIVDFYAPWCGACRALYPKLLKLMAEFPEIVFLKVNFDENKAMCKTLGVKVLPYFHAYHGAEGRVAAFSCTNAKFQRMRDAIEDFYTPICSLEDNPGLPEFPDIVPHPSEVTRLDSTRPQRQQRRQRRQRWSRSRC